MQAEILEIWKVLGERDQTEGRGGSYVVGYAKTMAIAEELSAGKGIMGYPGQIEKIKAVKFEDGKIYPLGEECTGEWAKYERRAEALAKLTPEDRDALGLK